MTWAPLLAADTVPDAGSLVLVLAAASTGAILSRLHSRIVLPTVVLIDRQGKEIGRLLYTDYVYPFEIAAVILLVAIVAAIAITLRRRKTTKYQDPALQVNVRRQDRVRLVSVPSEKREPAPEDAKSWCVPMAS